MKLVRQLVLFIVIAGIALRLSGLAVSSWLLAIAVAGELCLVGLVVIGVMRLWRARARGAEHGGPEGWDALRTILRESLPEGAADAVVSEARVLVAALRSLTFRRHKPVQVKPGWRRFGVMESAGYGNVVVMLLLLIAVEAPAVHIIVGALMDEGTLRTVVRGVLLGSSIYLAVWLIGDLRLLRETPGVLLSKDTLAIEVGIRVHGMVPLEKLVAATPLAQDGSASSSASRAALRSIRVSPHPNPNCRVSLNSSIALRGFFGLPVEGEMLDIFVDQPGELVASIASAIAAAKPAEA